jgi:hypothetical protein
LHNSEPASLDKAKPAALAWGIENEIQFHFQLADLAKCWHDSQRQYDSDAISKQISGAF